MITEIIDTSGFYLYQNEELFCAPHYVIFPDGREIYIDNKDSYQYPVEGWYYFDTIEEAKVFFNIPDIEE